METQRIESGNAVLDVKIYSPDKDMTIVLLNGGPGVQGYLEDVAISLRNSFRVITFDQRGVGQSKLSINSYSVDDYINDLNAIVVTLRINEFHLFGHSWGGLLIQLYAMKFPDKVISLFLCNPFPGLGHQWVLMEKEITQFVRLSANTNRWVKFLYNYLSAKNGIERGDKAMRRLIVLFWEAYSKSHGILEHKSVFSLRGINAEAIFKTRENIINTQGSILDDIKSVNRIPTFILFGTNDIFLETKWITRARYPFAQYLELEGGGLFPWLEKKDTFMQVLRQFYDMTDNNYKIGINEYSF